MDQEEQVKEVVETPQATATGPLQIIQTSDADHDCFILNEDNLNSIISKIPPDMKVAVVAVVGAFRTGKSFLLNFFLRYLRSNAGEDDLSQAWMTSEGEELSEGNMNEGGWSLVESEQAKREMSFQWRGGEQRQTTGIWMWSEPFIRETKASKGEKLAVLLMDTQGMFDNETTMTLTAQIFGLSTLVSSFQIYNVDKRIQEDNLQHLALFSEYGRMALLPQGEFADAKVALEEKLSHITDAEVLAQSVKDATASASEEATSKPTEHAAASKPTEGAPASSSEPKLARQPSLRGTLARKASARAMADKKPFQRLQFLVRDWQNFDKDYNEGDGAEVFREIHEEMQSYLGEVLRTRNLSDLQSTREQIVRCFEKLDCFLLPYPGSQVTRKNFDGAIHKIDPSFRALINQYVRIIFDGELESKEINARAITGPELKTYFEVYVKMFQAGEKSFPKAMTMLDATAEANNRNAYDLALAQYKTGMDAVAGKDKPFVKEVELREVNGRLMEESLNTFDDIATMGADSAIEKVRDSLVEVIEAEKTRYFTTNALRNPFKDLEFYLLPVMVAVVAWIMSVLTDITCSTDFCERVEDTFVNIYFYILFIIIVLTWKQISSALRYLKEIMPELAQHVQAHMSDKK